MDDVYIIGSGGFAKEVYCLLISLGKYNFRGFVDKMESETIIGSRKLPVITEDQFKKLNLPYYTNLVIGTGNPKLNHQIVTRFHNYTFPNIFHKNVIFDKESIIFGKGNIITAGVILTTCIKVGDFNIFNLNVTVGHDTTIGSFNVINPSVNISGGVVIGDRNLIGVSSCILQYKTIGSDSVIGASSLINKDVESSITVVGIPARKLIK